MFLRRRFKQVEPLSKRLTEQAKRWREEAEAASPGVERDLLLKRARQAEMASHMDEWLSSKGLQPPT